VCVGGSYEPPASADAARVATATRRPHGAPHDGDREARRACADLYTFHVGGDDDTPPMRLSFRDSVAINLFRPEA
jgi:hypothetical protein